MDSEAVLSHFKSITTCGIRKPGGWALGWAVLEPATGETPRYFAGKCSLDLHGFWYIGISVYLIRIIICQGRQWKSKELERLTRNSETLFGCLAHFGTCGASCKMPFSGSWMWKAKVRQCSVCKMEENSRLKNAIFGGIRGLHQHAQSWRHWRHRSWGACQTSSNQPLGQHQNTTEEVIIQCTSLA